MSAGQVVGDCVRNVVDVGHPVIAADIGNVEEVEHIDSNPDAFEMAPEVVGTHTFGRLSEKSVLEADIDTAVG